MMLVCRCKPVRLSGGLVPLRARWPKRPLLERESRCHQIYLYRLPGSACVCRAAPAGQQGFKTPLLAAFALNHCGRKAGACCDSRQVVKTALPPRTSRATSSTVLLLRPPAGLAFVAGVLEFHLAPARSQLH